MSPKLQPMAVQYYCHVSPSVYCTVIGGEFLSRDKDVDLTYIRFGIILTQFCVKFSRQEHKMDVL